MACSGAAAPGPLPQTHHARAHRGWRAPCGLHVALRVGGSGVVRGATGVHHTVASDWRAKPSQAETLAATGTGVRQLAAVRLPRRCSVPPAGRLLCARAGCPERRRAA